MTDLYVRLVDGLARALVAGLIYFAGRTAKDNELKKQIIEALRVEHEKDIQFARARADAAARERMRERLRKAGRNDS